MYASQNARKVTGGGIVPLRYERDGNSDDEHWLKRVPLDELVACCQNLEIMHIEEFRYIMENVVAHGLSMVIDPDRVVPRVCALLLGLPSTATMAEVMHTLPQAGIESLQNLAYGPAHCGPLLKSVLVREVYLRVKGRHMHPQVRSAFKRWCIEGGMPH